MRAVAFNIAYEHYINITYTWTLIKANPFPTCYKFVQNLEQKSDIPGTFQTPSCLCAIPCTFLILPSGPVITTYCYGDQINEDEMGVACSTHGEMVNACKILVGKAEGKRPLGRQRRRWEDNIKMVHREMG